MRFGPPSPYTGMREQRWLGEAALPSALSAFISSSLLPPLRFLAFLDSEPRASPPWLRDAAEHQTLAARTWLSPCAFRRRSMFGWNGATWQQRAHQTWFFFTFFPPLNEMGVNCACVAEDPVQCGASRNQEHISQTNKGQIVPICKNTSKHPKNPG